MKFFNSLGRFFMFWKKDNPAAKQPSPSSRREFAAPTVASVNRPTYTSDNSAPVSSDPDIFSTVVNTMVMLDAMAGGPTVGQGDGCACGDPSCGCGPSCDCGPADQGVSDAPMTEVQDAPVDTSPTYPDPTPSYDSPATMPDTGSSMDTSTPSYDSGGSSYDGGSSSYDSGSSSYDSGSSSYDSGSSSFDSGSSSFDSGGGW